MTKAEFLGLLRNRLTGLPQLDIEKAVAYYEENIDDRMEDGESEEQAVAGIGNIDDVVKEILMDTPFATLVQSRIKEGSRKIKGNTLWLVLAICGFPLWFPLAIAFAAVLLALYITVWAIIISIYAVVFSLAASSVAGLIAGIILCFTQGFLAGFSMIGMSLVAAGMFLASLKPSVWLSKMIVVLTGKFFKRIFFLNKKETLA